MESFTEMLSGKSGLDMNDLINEDDELDRKLRNAVEEFVRALPADRQGEWV